MHFGFLLDFCIPAGCTYQSAVREGQEEDREPNRKPPPKVGRFIKIKVINLN